MKPPVGNVGFGTSVPPRQRRNISHTFQGVFTTLYRNHFTAGLPWLPWRDAALPCPYRKLKYRVRGTTFRVNECSPKKMCRHRIRRTTFRWIRETVLSCKCTKEMETQRCNLLNNQYVYSTAHDFKISNWFQEMLISCGRKKVEMSAEFRNKHIRCFSQSDRLRTSGVRLCAICWPDVYRKAYIKRHKRYALFKLTTMTGKGHVIVTHTRVPSSGEQRYTSAITETAWHKNSRAYAMLQWGVVAEYI